MNKNSLVITEFFIVAVVIGIIADLLFTYFLTNFEATTQGQLEATYASPVYAAGVAAGAFTISLLLYPVVKKGTRNYEGEDYR
ncbi:hypothetical protein [Caldiplasma sukawensis]